MMVVVVIGEGPVARRGRSIVVPGSTTGMTK